jgi:hypothetical protein
MHTVVSSGTAPITIQSIWPEELHSTFDERGHYLNRTGNSEAERQKPMVSGGDSVPRMNLACGVIRIAKEELL